MTRVSPLPVTPLPWTDEESAGTHTDAPAYAALERGTFWTGAARWFLLLVISAVFTGWVMGWSSRHGRLAAPAFLDDVSYFIDAVHRLNHIDTGGTALLVSGFKDSPPHSFFSTLLAVSAFAIFGVHAWAPYLFNGLIILAMLRIVDWLMGDAPIWQRLLGYGLVLCTRFPWVCITEFKPDMAWGIASAAAVIATLHRPFLQASRARQIGVGAAWGAALLIKSSTLPVTLATMFASMVLMVLCDFDRHESSDRSLKLERSINAVGVMLLVAMLIAAPYYIVAWKDTYEYFKTNALGSQKSWWSLPGGFWTQVRYYFDGDSSFFMIGWHLWVLLALIAVGGIVALIRRPRSWRRVAALAVALIVMYLIPTIPDVKGLTLGSAFQAMLILLSIMGLAELFRALCGRWRGAATVLLCALMLAIILPFEMRQPMWNSTDALVTSYNAASHGIMDAIKKDADGSTAYICVTTEGIVTGWVPLQFRAYEENVPFTFANLQPYFNPQASAPRLQLASYVLASEAGNADISAFEPQDIAADDTLSWIRNSGEFDEMASFPAQNGKRFFLFSNRYCGFGGYDVLNSSMTASFPADLSRLTPVFRAGLNHATRLRVLVNEPCDKLLKISVYNRYPNQTLGVHLDQNKEWLLRENLPQGDIRMYDYRHFEVPLHLTAGSHILRLTYTNCNPDNGWPEAVIYRQLKIVDMPANSTTRPTTQPVVQTSTQ